MAKWRFDRRRRQLLCACRRGAARDARPAPHHRAHHRADAHALRQLVGRQLHRRPGGGLLQAVHRRDRNRGAHRDAGVLRAHQGAGAVRQLRVRHDLDQFHAVAARAAARGWPSRSTGPSSRRARCPTDAIVADGYGVAFAILAPTSAIAPTSFRTAARDRGRISGTSRNFPAAASLCISDPPRTCIFALLADGVPMRRLYPLDFDRAFRKLDQIKPHIKVWWREGNQSQQLIRDGEVDMMSIWNARGTELKATGCAGRGRVERRGAQREHLVCAQGCARPQARLGVHRISPRKPSPRPSSTPGSITARPIPAPTTLIPQEIAVQLPTYRDNVAVSVKEDDVWEADRIARSEERFTQWLAS